MAHSDACAHQFTEFGRVVFAGGGYHVAERCKVCRAQLPGWVPHANFDDPGSLPVFRDGRSPEERGEQRLLF